MGPWVDYVEAVRRNTYFSFEAGGDMTPQYHNIPFSHASLAHAAYLHSTPLLDSTPLSKGGPSLFQGRGFSWTSDVAQTPDIC